MMDNMYYLPINRKTGLNLSMDYVKETIEVMRNKGDPTTRRRTNATHEIKTLMKDMRNSLT